MSPLDRRWRSWTEKPAELQPLTPTASRSRVATIEFRVARGGAGLLPEGAGGAKKRARRLEIMRESPFAVDPLNSESSRYPSFDSLAVRHVA